MNGSDGTELRPDAGREPGVTPALRQKVREALAARLLPPAQSGSTVRRGTGQPCFICHEPIVSTELERELRLSSGRSSKRVLVHEPCLLVWRVESMLRARALGVDNQE